MASSSGGCLCGAVRFVAEGAEPHYHACHCGMCRRWSGGAPLLSLNVRSVQFDGVDHVVRYKSSEWAERGFCRVCGTNLFYLLLPTQTYSMSLGVFDDISSFAFTREIFIDHKPESYAFAGDRPRLTEAEVFAAFKASS